MDRHGTSYATDALSDAIYRVARNGRAAVLVRDPRFAAPIAGATGIVWHPHGYLLVANHESGALFRVPTADPTVTEVGIDRARTAGRPLATGNPVDTFVIRRARSTHDVPPKGRDGVRGR